MKRLNIFVDETGEFGFSKGASELYGVSFTFHEQDNNINEEIDKLNERLKRIGYTGMIHMADLIMKRGDYSSFPLSKRQSIFKAIFHFSRNIDIKYHTIIIDKRYTDSSKILKKQLINEKNKMIKNNEKFFNKFDRIVMYYDNGQESLGKILVSIFLQYEGFEHKINFNHKEKRLFQVSDMLTYVDKLAYKHKNNIKFSKGDLYFFGNEKMRKIINDLKHKRLNH